MTLERAQERLLVGAARGLHEGTAGVEAAPCGRVGRARQVALDADRLPAAGDLRIWQDRMRARSAAIEILLPVAAVAIGLLILATINHFTPR